MTTTGRSRKHPVDSADLELDGLSKRIGQRIRHLRKARGESLREMATALSVSPAALSMLENGRTGVSLQRLQRIAGYFGLMTVDLLGDTRDGGEARLEIVRACLATLPSVERKPGVTYQLASGGQFRALQAFLVSFAPGSGYTSDKIGHQGEEIVYVFAGEVEFVWGDEVVRLSQGDMVTFSSDRPHAFRNGSKSGPAMILSVGTPVW